jgi:hypothetical protein
MNNKLVFNVILSTILLLPVSVLLENLDGLETVNSIQGYLKEWMAGLILSLIMSGVIYGVKKIFKKDTSFLNVYSYTSYLFSIIILFILISRYL